MDANFEQLTKDQEMELINAFKAGNEEIFDQLVSLYFPRLFRVAYGLLGNKQDAEEVVQDAFVRAYKALIHFRGDASFETWMHRITVNLSRNRFHWNRRRGSEISISLSSPISNKHDDHNPHAVDFPDSTHQPDQLLEQDEIGWNIVHSIEHLPEPLRQTMTLRHLNNMTYEQIAKLLDCKVGTVKSRLARGRDLLKNSLNTMEINLSSKALNKHLYQHFFVDVNEKDPGYNSINPQ